ncbi:MAG: aldo/keto reductase [Lachnospiraceae bacterium]|jgi:diketogulonate reductase-like aldo/keto reductase|nr:aldo/keto reductase [Lachnospiraceae bacterium]
MDTEVKPMVDQIEYHPGFLQQETVDYCKKHDIIVEAWSPFGRGRVLKDPRLESIARGHGKSVAQVCIRFAMQNGIVPLPKSVNLERIDENFDVFDFELNDEEMNEINSFEEFGWSGLDPDEIGF